METPSESGAGYPEEQPEEVASEHAPRENRDREDEGRDEAAESGDGKATGNPRSAG